jgi:hypothetical protein
MVDLHDTINTKDMSTENSLKNAILTLVVILPDFFRQSICYSHSLFIPVTRTIKSVLLFRTIKIYPLLALF